MLFSSSVRPPLPRPHSRSWSGWPGHCEGARLAASRSLLVRYSVFRNCSPFSKHWYQLNPDFNNWPNLQNENSEKTALKGLKTCSDIHIQYSYVLYGTGCSLNIVFLLKKLWFFWTLPVLLQRWFSTCLVCVHWHWGKTEKGQVRNSF